MDMFALLKQIDPPLGFGSKCPDLLAYKRLVRMNMPVDIEGKVHFKTTLFALVRVNLQIFLRSMDEMDQADQELRATICKIWPFTKRDGSVDIIVPPPEGKGWERCCFHVVQSLEIRIFFVLNFTENQFFSNVEKSLI